MPYKPTVLTFIFFTALFTSMSNQLLADQLGSFGERIFAFQMRLAKNGNTIAQYKLGTLYEFGVSVPPNIDEAMYWYQKAAEDNYKPAINRLGYLDIRINGFDKDKHQAWYESLLDDIKQIDSDAIVLYGQMHRHGIVVERNLPKAVDYLKQASSLGHTEVDTEVEEIERQIAEAESKAKAREVEAKVSQAKPLPKTQVTRKPNTQKQITKSKAEEKNDLEEKRRRYEEAMRKFREEARMLERQQKWAESE